MAIKEILK